MHVSLSGIIDDCIDCYRPALGQICRIQQNDTQAPLVHPPKLASTLRAIRVVPEAAAMVCYDVVKYAVHAESKLLDGWRPVIGWAGTGPTGLWLFCAVV